MDDDESTKVSTVLKSAGCRRTFRRRLSWTERRPQGANWAGNRIVVGGGRKTAGHFISGAGYRSQWPRYATGDLGPMRGKLIAVCRQIVEVTYNYAPREADPQRQRKLSS